MTPMLIIYASPPSSSTGSNEDSSKNEGFLKSVWHKLTDKHNDASKPESKGAKDADAKNSDKKENGKDESKNSS